jgi:hypothetical protein
MRKESWHLPEPAYIELELYANGVACKVSLLSFAGGVLLLSSFVVQIVFNAKKNTHNLVAVSHACKCKEEARGKHAGNSLEDSHLFFG